MQMRSIKTCKLQRYANDCKYGGIAVKADYINDTKAFNLQQVYIGFAKNRKRYRK